MREIAYRLSRSQRAMLRNLAAYDEIIHYTTTNGNEIRTIRSLARLGLVVAEEYVDEPGRWFAYKASGEF